MLNSRFWNKMKPRDDLGGIYVRSTLSNVGNFSRFFVFFFCFGVFELHIWF